MADLMTRLEGVLQRDPRYREDAYFFVLTALDRALKSLVKPRHVSGPELLEHIRREAAEQFGPMAASVFQHWGVDTSPAFGNIVFNLVDEGILLRSEADRLEHFEDPFFFDKLFDTAAAYRLTE